MANKDRSAERFRETEKVFRCPICHQPVNVVDFKSVICSNKHTFDFAKQGYVNMMTRPSTTHYDKALFTARQKIMKESDLYAKLYPKLADILKTHPHANADPTVMLDAGCGEGSHLQRILAECNDQSITGIGLDAAKEGIVMAAKHDKESLWLVGDLANAPLADQSCHIVLNILSPANYMEFKRILASDGLVIKVVPRVDYLKELRQMLFDDESKQSYSNEQIVSLFKQQFHLLEHDKLRYSRELNGEALTNLVQMSPLAWNAETKQVDAFINQDSQEVTVDLDILVGTHKHSNGRSM